jgi:crotonobetainyl-CoA:carnitine CoA-transferase CaiB-like acyl-CoA transferase
VVLHNQRLPIARKLGFDEASLRRVRPDLVYTHVSAYGPVGPRKDWPGYDQLFQAASGWELDAAGEGNRPTWLRFGMIDHLAGLASLLGTLGALYHRRRAGVAHSVSASLLGASLFSVDTAVDWNGQLLPYPKLDRRQLGVSPLRRLYRCRDGWLAVSCAAEDALTEVFAATGCRDVDALEAWMMAHELAQASQMFDVAGVPCVHAALNNKTRFFNDDSYQAAGLIAKLAHPVYGQLQQIGAMWHFDNLTLALDRAPPMLGQHSREVLREAGLPDAEIDTLVALGVVSAM